MFRNNNNISQYVVIELNNSFNPHLRHLQINNSKKTVLNNGSCAEELKSCMVEEFGNSCAFDSVVNIVIVLIT